MHWRSTPIPTRTWASPASPSRRSTARITPRAKRTARAGESTRWPARRARSGTPRRVGKPARRALRRCPRESAAGAQGARRPISPAEERAVPVEAACELDGERQTVRPFAVRHGDAGNAQQGPGAVEDRVAGALVRARGFARRAGRQQEIDVAHSVRQGAAALAGGLAHGVVVGARDLPSFVEARLQARADLLGEVHVLPGKGAGALEAHDDSVAVEERFAPCRQLELAHRGAGPRQAPGGLLEVRLRRGVGV